MDLDCGFTGHTTGQDILEGENGYYYCPRKVLCRLIQLSFIFSKCFLWVKVRVTVDLEPILGTLDWLKVGIYHGWDACPSRGTMRTTHSHLVTIQHSQSIHLPAFVHWEDSKAQANLVRTYEIPDKPKAKLRMGTWSCVAAVLTTVLCRTCWFKYLSM